MMSELFKLTVILILGGYIFLSCLRLMSSKLFFQKSISEAFICKIIKPNGNHLFTFFLAMAAAIYMYILLHLQVPVL